MKNWKQINMLEFSNRLSKLGTETAFAVSEDANQFKSLGNTIYPFHLGDLNISTPKNIMDATEKAMRSGKTGYVQSAGIPELRSVIAQKTGEERNLSFDTDNVIVQPGGKPVISKFIQAIINKGDGVLYPNPGYPIYESQIDFHDGHSLPYGFIFENNRFIINREQIEQQIDHKTKIFIYNNNQNPVGMESSQEEMEWLAELCQKHDLWVLSDEAYFNIRYSGQSNSIASLPGMAERTVILYTFSKTYAMTGWRLGAAIGPKNIMKIISKLGVNDESCTNHFIQYGGIEALTGEQSEAVNIVETLKKRRDTLYNELKNINGIDVFKPDTTFYLFPDITDIYNKMGVKSYEEFRIKTLKQTGVAFCTREHFGTPHSTEDRKYIRFAFSGISEIEIIDGMKKLKNFWSNIGESIQTSV